jgi:superfamily II DNA helicase RecQ
LLQGNDAESVHIVKRLYRHSALDQAVTAKVKLLTSDIVIQDVDIDAGLRKLFGWGAKWKSKEQQACIAHIMTMQSDGVRGDLLITMLSTSGGKSILFMLPALMDDTSTSFSPINIVIVPFVTLAEDLTARAREFGIDCFRWQQLTDEEQCVERKRDVQLVVVSVD